jgi:hypothetical protein
LQKATIGRGNVDNKSQRLLLGLVSFKDDTRPCVESRKPATDSLPDAWIYGDDYAVLIESKVRESLDPDQMQRHFQKLQVGTHRQPKYALRTWAEVHQFFKALPDGELIGKDKWLIEQFTQYLEWIGRAEFTGFEPEIFDYFIAHNDEDVKQRVRGTMSSFAKKVLNKLQDEAQLRTDPFWYTSSHTGNLSLNDDHCWVAFFGPGNQKFRKWAHQTISVYSHGLDIFVNVELKPAIVRLRRKIRQDEQAFRETITSLSAPLSIRVEERKHKRPRYYDYYPVASLEAAYFKNSDLGPIGFDYIERLLDRIDLPSLTAVKHIDRERALELSKGDGNALVDHVVGVMKELYPLVKFINTKDKSGPTTASAIRSPETAQCSCQAKSEALGRRSNSRNLLMLPDG